MSESKTVSDLAEEVKTYVVQLLVENQALRQLVIAFSDCRNTDCSDCIRYDCERNECTLNEVMRELGIEVPQ